MADDFFSTLDIAASGLQAEGERMNVVALNIANAQTTRTDAGTPYRRRQIVFRAMLGDRMGVRVEDIVEDPSAFRTMLSMGHPDADDAGYVQMPNVNVPLEMVDMISASRAYQANLAVMKHFKDIAHSALELLR